MEPEQTPEAPNIEQTSKFENLKKVTPLSKYLAMALFIILPFLGGYVGYMYAPEKVVEVERIVFQEVSKDDIQALEAVSEYKESRYGSFVLIDPTLYPLAGYELEPQKNNLVVPVEKLRAESARKISENLVILTIGDGNDRLIPYATVIYDEEDKSIVRQIDYPWSFVNEWFGLSVQVFVDEKWNESSRVVLRDYVNNKEEILYIEQEEDVQLIEFSAYGGKGVIYITGDGQVIFGRHKSINGTDATRLLDIMTVSIPEEYLSEQQRKYREGIF